MRMSLEREGRGGSDAEVSKLLSTEIGQPGGIMQSFREIVTLLQQYQK